MAHNFLSMFTVHYIVILQIIYTDARLEFCISVSKLQLSERMSILDEYYIPFFRRIELL